MTTVVLSKIKLTDNSYFEIKQILIEAGRQDLIGDDGSLRLHEIACVRNAGGSAVVTVKVNGAYRHPVFEPGQPHKLTYDRVVGMTGLRYRTDYTVTWSAPDSKQLGAARCGTLAPGDKPVAVLPSMTFNVQLTNSA